MATTNDTENTVAMLRRRLNEQKGTWPTISKESSVPYGTLEKIAQGDTLNPQFDTVDKLLGYFRALDAMHASLKAVEARA